jgi:hypothetical protein
MTRTVRLTTLVTLLVAFVVTGLVPAQGSWSCPNGTACVYTAGRGFHCVGDECERPCCARAQRRAGCGTCHHGAMPGIATKAAAATRNVGESQDCRYRDAPQFQPVRLTESAAPVFQWTAVAAPPSFIELPVTEPLWQRLAPIRGSPLPARISPPSAPRAPPAMDCA